MAKQKNKQNYIIGIDEVGRAASKRLASPNYHYVIGIDEVGRGALAGPVVVAALAAPYSLIKHKLDSRIFANKNLRLIRDIRLKDSKRLTARQREIWFQYIKKSQKSKVKGQRLYYKTASVSPKIIDKINISQAANLAATTAFKKLLKYDAIASYLSKRKIRIFLDGGLYINKPITNNLRLTIKNYKTKTIIKGDEKIPAIAMASIMAKVSRDKRMRRLHKRYPQYDFINNVGYGTKKHIKAIKKFGPSPIHRKSFKIKELT